MMQRVRNMVACSSELHVVPCNDLRPHSTDSDVPCWCKPTNDDGVIVHNSMDGREAFETGERKPS